MLGLLLKGFISSMRSFYSIIKFQSKAFLKDHMHYYRVIL